MSLLLLSLTFSLTAFALPSSWSNYTLRDTYNYTNWMSMFEVQNITDPTAGFVTYVSQDHARSSGMYKVQGNQVYIGVDHTNVISPNGTGRNSVRLQSNAAYNHALVIANFAHVPSNECGSWPAFWMVGPNWPSSGEIDVFEGVNMNTNDIITLHTSSGCTPTIGGGGQTGKSGGSSDCGSDGGYMGCSVSSTDPNSYGAGFNNNGGGVFASLWTSSGIKVWHFSAGNIPADITSGKPDPTGWPMPTANFGGCDFDRFFKDLYLVFDITFCGQWAGNVWGSSPCAARNSCCSCYVAQNPGAYKDLYFLVNSIKVYNV